MNLFQSSLDCIFSSYIKFHIYLYGSASLSAFLNVLSGIAYNLYKRILKSNVPNTDSFFNILSFFVKLSNIVISIYFFQGC